MTRLPPAPLVPNNTLITATAEEGRAFITLARHSIHAMQKELEVLKSGRAQIRARSIRADCSKYVVAVEFRTIAAANNYWRLASVGKAFSPRKGGGSTFREDGRRPIRRSMIS